MIPIIPVLKDSRADTYSESQKKVIDTGGHAPAAFSRASHFAFALIPMALGVGYAMIRDAEGSFLFRLGVYSMLLFGLGGAISLLCSLDRLQDWEERHRK